MCQSMMLKDNGKYCSVFPLFKYILEFENLGRIVFQKQKKNLEQKTNKWGFLLSVYEHMCPLTYVQVQHLNQISGKMECVGGSYTAQ